MRRPRPLDATSIVFGGFILLVLLSQLSAHVLAEALIVYQGSGSVALAKMRSLSVVLAASAAVLGVAFGTGVLLITRKKLVAEIDVYRANGLPLTSALSMMISYHPVRPLLWLAGATTVGVAGDALFGLSVTIPLDLAASFAALLMGWVVLLTVYMFGHRGFREDKAKVG